MVRNKDNLAKLEEMAVQFNGELRGRITALGETQAVIAERTGLSQKEVSRLVHGKVKRTFSLERLILIAFNLGLEVHAPHL